MIPRDLHPDLGPYPEPKPVCCGCSATEPDAILVPLRSIMFICGTCASMASLDVLAETGRKICEAILRADVTAPLRGAT